MVESQPSMLLVASSILVSRSNPPISVFAVCLFLGGFPSMASACLTRGGPAHGGVKVVPIPADTRLNETIIKVRSCRHGRCGRRSGTRPRFRPYPSP